MPIRKILLKTLSGVPVTSLTLRTGLRPSLTFPPAFLVEACECDGERLSLQEKIPLPATLRDLSLLGKMDGVILFASTLPAEKAALARERLLLGGQPKEENLPKSPLEIPLSEEESPRESALAEKENAGPTITPFSDAEQSPSQDADEPQEEAPLCSNTRAERLVRILKKMENGEPFDLFRELMPTYRWAKIREEEGEYLLGVEEESDPPHVLFGVAGSRAYPPDEDRLWTFFPTEGEEGYYLTEEEV